MAKLDVSVWRDRIRYGREVQRRMGLIGSEHQGVMRELISMYRGRHWDFYEVEGIDDEQAVTLNNVFSLWNQYLAEIAARRPEVQLLPRGGINVQLEVARANAKKARLVQPLINYDIDELGMEIQANDVLADTCVGPYGVMRSGFTPREEIVSEEGKRINRFRHIRPDKPWVRRWPLWDTVLDPTSTRFHADGGMMWCAFRSVEHIDDVKANPHMRNVKGLSDYAGHVRPETHLLDSPDKEEQLKDPDRNKYIEIWTVYEIRDRTWFQITLDGPESPLRMPDDWPIDWEWLPVTVLVPNPQRDTPFGVPWLGPILPVQRERNRIRSIMSWLANNTRRLVFINEERLKDPAERKKLESAALTEIIRCTGNPGESIEQISLGGITQELLVYDSRLDEDMREMLGLSKPGRGQRINVESATEANNVQQGQDVNMDRSGVAYERFWKDFLTMHIQARRATMDVTGNEVFRVVGEIDANGLQEWADVSPEDLHADFDFLVVPGSTRKRNLQMLEQREMARFQFAADKPDIFNLGYRAEKLIEAQGDNPERALNKQALTAGQVRGVGEMERNINEAAAPGSAGGGNGSAATAGIVPALLDKAGGQ